MASTDAKPVPQKNVAYRVTFPILDADGDLVTGATGLDSEISKDGGTFADCTNEATEIATSSGVYYLDLTSTEMNADTVAIIVKTTSSGAKTTTIVMYPEEAGDIRVNVTQFGGTNGTFASGRPEVNLSHIAGSAVSTSTAQLGVNVVNFGGSAGTFASGRPEVNTTHAAGTAWGSGAITAASIASNAIAAAKIASGAITSAKFAAGAIDATAIADNAIDAGAIATGAITAAKFGAGAIDAAALAADAGTEIATAVWASGTRVLTANTNLNDPTAAAIADAVWDELQADHVGAGSFGLIASEIADILTDTAEIGAAGAGLTEAGGTGDHLTAIVWNAAWDAEVQSEVADALAVYDPPTHAELASATANLDATVSSRLASASYTAPDNASIAAILTDTGTTLDGKIDTIDGIVDAIKLKTDNLPASPAATGDAMTLTAAYDFAKGTVAMTEAYAANGAAPTPVQAMFAIHQMLMQHAISGTTWSAYKLDNVTVAFDVTLDDATNPTSARRV